MDEQAKEEYGSALVGATKLGAPNEPRSPLADALQTVEKAFAGLELNIDTLDMKLLPLQLRQAEDSRTQEGAMAERAPTSDLVNGIIEIAQRINRNAQKVRRISKDLEI